MPMHDLAWLNSLSAEEAAKELRQCCGSRRWAEQIVERSTLLNARDLNHARRSGLVVTHSFRLAPGISQSSQDW